MGYDCIEDFLVMILKGIEYTNVTFCKPSSLWIAFSCSNSKVANLE